MQTKHWTIRQHQTFDASHFLFYELRDKASCLYMRPFARNTARLHTKLALGLILSNASEHLALLEYQKSSSTSDQRAAAAIQHITKNLNFEVELSSCMRSDERRKN
jgi:hypothetical protein